MGLIGRRRSAPLRRPPPLKLEHALAGGLGVEEFVGGHRLVQLEAVGEQALHVDAVLDDEARAVRLALLVEGPGADQRDLAADQVLADLEGDLAGALRPLIVGLHRLNVQQTFRDKNRK